MQKRWKILSADEGKVSRLQKDLGIHALLCNMLVSRGIESFHHAKAFFRPALAELHSPWLMKGMHAAVDRILHAIRRREKILIYGDYDVDGTTAVALVYQFLAKVHDADCLGFYVPHRFREGYGVSKAGIDYAQENNFTLVISLDCGIKSAGLIADAKSRGVDFIVCDHHLPDSELPPAIAILNPKQIDCDYPYKDLCGCGVGYKLVTALAENLGLPNEEVHKYLDLVATAIAADIVPITGENRIIVYHGLKKINDDPCPGIRALVALSGLKKSLSITNVVFAIAPRVNAAGRMDDAAKAVRLFIENDYNKALPLAENAA